MTFRGYECVPVVLTPSSDSKTFTPEGTQKVAINRGRKAKTLKSVLQVWPVSRIDE